MGNITEIIANYRPLIALGISPLAALLILTLGEKIRENTREAITLAAAVIKAVCIFSLVPEVLGGRVFSYKLVEIAAGIDLAIKVDPMGLVFACIASSLWIITSVYSIGYMRGHGEEHQTGYYAAFAMCLFGAVGICFAANLLTFFIFYEILTIATYPLVVHHRDLEGKRSGRIYLIYTLSSGQLFFAGTAYIYYKCGTTEFVPGGFIGTNITDSTCLWVFSLMIVAGAVKAGMMPLHSWLPKAMVAPTPVSALLHAVAVVKAGAFCVIRVVFYVFGPDLAARCGGATVMTWLAGITILLSSLIAIQKTNLKARLAFSTIGQLSYIILGVCLLTPESAIGAIYHMVAHAFLKITLFMVAGAIFVTCHKADIREMRGVGRRMPVTMTCFTLASFGIAGLPFLPAFFSKMNIMEGAYLAGKPVFIGILIISALLSLTYLVPVGYVAFAKTKVNSDFLPYNYNLKGEARWQMLVPIVVTIAISICLGINPDFVAHFYSLAKMAVMQIF